MLLQRERDENHNHIKEEKSFNVKMEEVENSAIPRGTLCILQKRHVAHNIFMTMKSEDITFAFFDNLALLQAMLDVLQ